MKRFFLLVGLVATAAHGLPRAPSANNEPAPDYESSRSSYWYANIKHNGVNPGIPDWTVFRNVLDYGAKGDGTTDDTEAIQQAITTGSSNGTRDTGKLGSTGQPAVVYFPPGVYKTSTTIQNYIGTTLMGDPIDRPTIKGSAAFNGSSLIVGNDPNYQGLNSFYHEIKNFVFDSTALPSTANITLVSWGVSQASQLSNSMFLMPSGAAGHTAIASIGQNSPLILQDLEIRGGGIGWTGTSTQYHFKNIHFKGVKTAILPLNTVQMSIHGCSFEGVTTGIDMSLNSLGLLNMFDSHATSTGVLVRASSNQTNSQGSIMLENVNVDTTVPIVSFSWCHHVPTTNHLQTIQSGSSAILTGSVKPGNTWIRGHIYAGSNDSTEPEKSAGRLIKTSRPHALVDQAGAYHTVTPPTYSEYTLDQIVNVKEVMASPVKGDGHTDDTASLQAILNSAAKAGKIAYFPHGIYILTDTLHIPCGSRLWGESFTELSGTGDAFKDEANLKPIIQVGKPGEVGVAQFTDFVFTVAEVLPGAIMVEVNMAGAQPGDVGFFNSHFRIGGAKNTKTTTCPSIEECKAVRLAAHLTSSSSSYWENSWAWSADLALDSEPLGAYPSPAGGFLIEATKGTWMLGWGVGKFTRLHY